MSFPHISDASIASCGPPLPFTIILWALTSHFHPQSMLCFMFRAKRQLPLCTEFNAALNKLVLLCKDSWDSWDNGWKLHVWWQDQCIAGWTWIPHIIYMHTVLYYFCVFYLSDRAYKDRLLHIVYPKRVKCLKGRSFNTTTWTLDCHACRPQTTTPLFPVMPRSTRSTTEMATPLPYVSARQSPIAIACGKHGQQHRTKPQRGPRQTLHLRFVGSAVDWLKSWLVTMDFSVGMDFRILRTGGMILCSYTNQLARGFCFAHNEMSRFCS